MKDGSMYRGLLEEAQDNMNLTMKDCVKTNSNGTVLSIDVAYVRGSQIRFIVLPNMLSKAPFFNRIKMWRKFKGHAVFGGGALIGPARGQSAAIIQKSQNRRMLVQGQGPPGAGPAGRGMPPPGHGHTSGTGAPPPYNPHGLMGGPPQGPGGLSYGHGPPGHFGGPPPGSHGQGSYGGRGQGPPGPYGR